MNKAQFYGRLTADPQLRYTQSGTAVTTFSIAVRRNYKNREGEYEADFIDCVAWRKPAEILANSLSKGHRVVVAGRIETSRYQDNEGNTRRKWELVVEDWSFVESANEGNGNGNQNGYNNQAQAAAAAPVNNYGTGYGGPVVAPDDVPF